MLLNHVTPKDNVISNVYGASFSILLKEYIKRNDDFNLVITEEPQQAYKFYKELKYLTKASTIEVLFFPSLEILAYDRFSASVDIMSQRQKILYKLANDSSKNIVLVTSIENALRKLAPIDFIQEHSFILKAGDIFDITKRKSQFVEAGYTLVNNVFTKGEFSIRGSIIDIYPIGSKIAYRIDLFDNEVDSIKELDIDTQRSKKDVNHIDIMPSHEFIYTDNTTNLALDQLEHLCSKTVLNSDIAGFIQNQEYFSGVEFYLPLFYKKLFSLFDYLPKVANMHLYGNVSNSIEAFLDDVKLRYNELRFDPTRPILHYEELFYSQNEFNSFISKHKTIKWLSEPISKSKKINLKPLIGVSANYKLSNPFKYLLDFLSKNSFEKVIFSTDSHGRAEILLEHLSKLSLDS